MREAENKKLFSKKSFYAENMIHKEDAAFK